MCLSAEAVRRGWNEKPIEFLTLIVTAIGLIVATGAAVFVYDQIVAVRLALDSQAYSTIAQGLTDLDKIFVQNPEIRPYFFENKSLAADDAQREKVLATADMYLNFIDNFYSQSPHIDWSHYQRDAWIKFFEDSFRHSKILCDVLWHESIEYGPEIKAVAEPMCADTKP